MIEPDYGTHEHIAFRLYRVLEEYGRIRRTAKSTAADLAQKLISAVEAERAGDTDGSLRLLMDIAETAREKFDEALKFGDTHIAEEINSMITEMVAIRVAGGVETGRTLESSDTLVEALTKEMGRRGHNQTDAARAMGCDLVVIARWLHGRPKSKLSQNQEAARRYLGISEDEMKRLL